MIDKLWWHIKRLLKILIAMFIVIFLPLYWFINQVGPKYYISSETPSFVVEKYLDGKRNDDFYEIYTNYPSIFKKELYGIAYSGWTKNIYQEVRYRVVDVKNFGNEAYVNVLVTLIGGDRKMTQYVLRKENGLWKIVYDRDLGFVEFSSKAN
ncbi:hypothetical protein Thena_0696 [Thermodesulfobium narugense DSM 14796]|uniref:DUF4878 domain-containing protein n=1 Tax=Thermodesulfobium narugense DSM 14796 TaxID=747365 RepID=M1E5L6_9BACT|nr:nuclear transport factor 2 family protein [Thermodesulfobium narugense]AEE14331.1 hypothetical protein Thena_0696 [Thermodesulfobium narugense DSM 14796]